MAKALRVYIPTYNRAHAIGYSLGGLLRQHYRDFDIVVVDNGSTDRTKLVVEEWKKKFSDIELTYEKKEKNVSVYLNIFEIASRNHPTSAFMLHGDDDVLLPSALSVLMQGFQSHPELSFFGINQFEGDLSYLPETDESIVPSSFWTSSPKIESETTIITKKDFANFFSRFNGQSFISAYVYRQSTEFQQLLKIYDQWISKYGEAMRLKIGYMMPYSLAVQLLMHGAMGVTSQKLLFRGMDAEESKNRSITRPKDAVKNTLDFSVSLLKFYDLLFQQGGEAKTLSEESQRRLRGELMKGSQQLRLLFRQSFYSKREILKTHQRTAATLLPFLGASVRDQMMFLLRCAGNIAIGACANLLLRFGLDHLRLRRRHPSGRRMSNKEFWSLVEH